MIYQLILKAQKQFFLNLQIGGFKYIITHMWGWQKIAPAQIRQIK